MNLRLLAWPFGIALVTNLAACAVAVPPCMAKAAPGTIVPPTSAIIVFVREGTHCDHGGFVRVLEKDGTYVGDIAPGARVAVAVAPGEHTFIGWDPSGEFESERYGTINWTAALKANLAESHTYYVDVHAAEGDSTRARCPRYPEIELLPMTPHNGRGGDIASLTEDTKPEEPRASCGQQMLLGQRADVDLHIRQGLEKWETYRPRTKIDRTIAPEDGI